MPVTLGLPLAGSIILTTAEGHDATLWTQDAALGNVEGVQYIERVN